jgi:carboxymethylenebutenolidase
VPTLSLFLCLLLVAAQVPVNERLPPPTDGALVAIDKSPRHGEWVSIPNRGGPAIKSWVVYPERSEKTPVIIVIHANQGLNDWARAVADQLAEDGYIAIAPDLLSGLGPVMARLDAVREYAVTLPAANGKTATIGFCWGGSRSFEYAVAQPALDAAVVFYGTSPPSVSDLANVNAAVLGLYGGDDARVNTTIDAAAAEMMRLGKVFEHEIYEGAGHGFVSSQSDRGGANYRATEKAWPRALAFLQEHLK